MKDAAPELPRARILAMRRPWRSWNSWRCPATPNAERGRRRGASVRRPADAPAATGATAPRNGAAADNRHPSGLCPESRRPWPRSRSADFHGRWDGPPQASRASGRRKGRRMAGRSHAHVDRAPGRKSAAAFQASPTPPAAARGRVRRRTRDRRGCPRAIPQAERHSRRLLASRFASDLQSENSTFEPARGSPPHGTVARDD